ncbi:HD domain-containing protein [Schaalia vaccimaxillae]|uniref:HD domain-containing protein n=1 Tax=Schaalia vaccimaxillae TaxID=183916 RepID=UPI0003B41835|nr:HD domain-containing protein [Schaalia vaccimaxillae]
MKNDTDDRLKRQLDFILKIDQEKNILRRNHLTDGGRLENDAEHAWHMAVMAYLLREYSNEPIDIGKTLIMCLIHDIVEIEAGDTYAYDEAGKADQAQREQVAKDKLFSLLPPDQRDELSALFDEFEAQETPEARFARAMDNLQPLLLNNSNDGQDWKIHSVKASQVRARQSRTKPGSQTLWELSERIIEDNTAKGNLPA